MPIVLKIDGSLVEPLVDTVLEVEIKMRVKDPNIQAGEAAFVWSHYSQPTARDGQLIALGVVLQSIRSEDQKIVDLRIALSSCPPTKTWRTEALDALKKRGDGSPETEIADEIRGYTHAHAGHVSSEAAALMAGHFI